MNWPERRPHCGQDLKEGNIMGFELQIKKGFKGLFAGGFGSKNLSMKPCGTLAKKVSNFRTIEAIGGVIMFGAIIGSILLKRFLKAQSMEYIYIIGSAFWPGGHIDVRSGSGHKKSSRGGMQTPLNE